MGGDERFARRLLVENTIIQVGVKTSADTKAPSCSHELGCK